MKIFRTIGILAVVLLVVSAYLPWAYIDYGLLHRAVLTGMDTGKTNYGKPAFLNLIFGALFLITVLIPRVWAKRIGIFFAIVVLAWNLRNYFLFACEMGYCPEKKIGLYLTVLAAILVMICALLPYVPHMPEDD